MFGNSEVGKDDQLIMHDIILLSGSPRLKGSTSMKLLELFKNRSGNDCSATIIEAAKSILQKKQLQDYACMAKAEAIVIAFPLYIYCLPGALIEFLVGYRDYISNTEKPAEQKIYAVINCGFPESRINEDAALVIKSFCKEIRAEYRFSVLIGSGGILQPLKSMPSVHKMWKRIGSAFDQIVCDVCGKNVCEDIHLDSRLPKKFFYFVAQTNFAVIAKMSGIKKKELFRKPYFHEI